MSYREKNMIKVNPGLHEMAHIGVDSPKHVYFMHIHRFMRQKTAAGSNHKLRLIFLKLKL